MKIDIPDTSQLSPHLSRLSNGRTLYAFPGDSTELVRLDLVSESGSAYQPQFLVAAAANNLYTAASADLDLQALAEFMDYRGIIIDNNTSYFSGTTTVYALRKYFDELLPVLEGLVRTPTFPDEAFEVYRARKRQELESIRFKARERVRRLFYMTLKGPDSIVGRYADPADTDRLTLDAVRDFYHRRHQPGSIDIILSGHVDDALVALVDSHFGYDAPVAVSDRLQMDNTVMPDAVGHRADPFDSAQTSLRVGRLIPLAWNDPEFADLMLLTTLLGGYFGSRLMNNLREDKGFTYGIMARNQLYRGTAFFHISADVAAGTADRAEEEIARELQRLVDEPVPEEELELVKTVFVGDFLRSVDGIFERAERFSSMFVSGIDERFTDNLRHSLLHSTPETLHRVARRWLSPDAMLFCRAGN